MSEMVQDRIVNRNLCAIYRMVLGLFPMTLSNLEWLSELCNDTKHRAACLRHLSFLIIVEFSVQFVSMSVRTASSANYAKYLHHQSNAHSAAFSEILSLYSYREIPPDADNPWP